ncbi:hypothetical protein EV361DRAFT_978062 [Lentinula raphanica]|nr:hypothetical protein EV361DRAFT_978062 [Lentinula raphanica]
MRNDDKVGAYNIKFNTLAAASGWDVNALRWAYQKGLAPRLKDEIARMPEPRTLSEYRREVLRLDNRYWHREEEKKRESHRFSEPSDPKKGKKDGKKPVPFNSSQNSGANQSSSSSGSNFNNQKKFSNSNNNKCNSGNKFPKKLIADNLGSDGKLTPAEREHHKKFNLCLFCGLRLFTSPGHRPVPVTGSTGQLPVTGQIFYKFQ